MDLNLNLRGVAWPWFTSTGQQNYLKKWCYGDLTMFKLSCPQYKLLPFQLLRADTGSNVPLTGFYIEKIGTGETFDLLSHVASNIRYDRSADLQWCTYMPDNLLQSLIPCGLYIAHATDGTNIWESEVISIEDFIDAIDGGVGAGIDIFNNALLISSNDFLKFSINNFITQ